MVFRIELLGEACMFNACVSLDLLYLDGKSILPSIDKDTKLSSACFLTV